MTVLAGEPLLALIAGLLAIGTLVLRYGRGAFWAIVIALGWLAWGATLVVAPPALATGYGSMISYAGVLAAALLAAIGGVRGTVLLGTVARAAAPRILLAAVAAAVLFLLPLLLWAVNALPNRYLADAFSLVLVIATVAAGSRWSGRQLPAASS
jgi:hypothetical protein